jgi:hypothetical protein
MKNATFWALLVLLGLSCQKDNNLGPGFDMLYTRDFSIPAGIGVFDVHHFRLKNVPSNWDQFLSLNGKTEDKITGVITAEASLGGIFGDVDLSVIDRISLRVYDDSAPNDYVEIAYRDPAPLDTGNILPLIPSLADARRFFKNSRVSFDVVIYLRRTTLDQSDVRLSLTMRATVEG